MKNNLAFILIYFIATLFFCGCNFLAREVYPRYADFPEVITLSQAKSISCDSVYLRYPYRVEINGSLAVILDLHPDSCFLHAFTYPEWRYVTSFGSRGEGPEDILSAERVRISSPDSVWVLDSNRCQITRWRISNGNAERVEEIPLDDRLIRTLDFCKTADGFLVTDYTGNYRYHVLDQCGKIIQSIGHVPSEKQGKHLPDGGSKLYTFTLTGLPVKCYELSKPVCGICVDEVQKSFFATDVFTDKLITEFDLKN